MAVLQQTISQTTEVASDRYEGLDTKDPREILELLIESQSHAVDAVRSRMAELNVAAQRMASCLDMGKTIYYVGAGSSLLMGFADAAELPGTFGIPNSQIKILMPAEVIDTTVVNSNGEDNVARGIELAKQVGSGDVVIAIAASGFTPFTLSVVLAARAKGATIIGLFNNAACTLRDLSDVAIFLDTGDEAIAGSTRLSAGSAQKIALNTISTLANILRGHVYDNLMVNMVVSNKKLQNRAAQIVSRISGASIADAEVALANHGQNIKLACLVCSLQISTAEATERLAISNGNLRVALNMKTQKTRRN